MLKYFSSFALLTGVSTCDLYAQSTSIQLDRPDQTECPFIVPKNYIQIENGFTYEHINSNTNSISFLSTLWKYGLNEHFEFRLITELITEQHDKVNTTGLLPITLGFKSSICHEQGIIPALSFIGHITTATIGSSEFHTSYIAPSFRFTLQHTLTNKISIAYNLGAEWDGETPEQIYIYSLTSGFSLTSKLAGFIEFYGFIPIENKTDHRLDCGFTYLLNNNLMVDLSGGFGLTENAPRNFVSFGISYRFRIIK